MARDDDDLFSRSAPAPTPHTIGEALDTCSVEELEKRIGLLHSEISRLEAALQRKRASREAAALFFKRGAEP